MDIANIHLAQNAAANDGGTGYYPKNAWGWVSWSLSYDPSYIFTSAFVKIAQVMVNCYISSYIRRTWYGNNFCTSSFRGY